MNEEANVADKMPNSGERRPGLCSSCGRTIAAGSTGPFCTECQASGAQDRDIEKIAFVCTSSRDSAIAAVRQWWLDPLVAPRLRDEGRIDECRLLFVPFWERTATIDGDVEGYRIYSDEYSDTRIPMEYHFDSCITWTGIACDAGDIEIGFLRNLAGETVRYEKCPGPTVDVTLPQKEAEEKSDRAIEKYIHETANIPNITSRRLKLDLRPIALLFYPLWLVRYSHSGHTYTATVDGVTGNLLAGRAPGNFSLRASALASGLIVGFVLVAIHVYTLFLGQYFSFLSGSSCGCVALSAGVVLLIIDLVSFDFVSANFGHFRYGAVTSIGDAKDGYQPVERSDTRGKFPAFISMLFGLAITAACAYFLFKGSWTVSPVLATALGLIIFLVSCWHSYDNTRIIKGEITEGTRPCAVPGRESQVTA